LRAENAYLRAQLHDKFKIDGIIGRTPIMLQLFELLKTVAATTSTVLITGETGTGKELAARAIHDGSARRAQRFVAINCSAIPETLLEAELFGHVRGAFTGAVAHRQGRIEQANRGTLFLDEVGTMSPALQSKLLRMLQGREFERVGDSQTIRVDVRVIAATNADLAAAAARGTFREDLYYRLKVYELRIPPLRRRGAKDLGALVETILTRLLARRHRPLASLDRHVKELFAHYEWPGNVRELENTLERMIVAAGGDPVLTCEHLPDDFGALYAKAAARLRRAAGRLLPFPRALPSSAEIAAVLERNEFALGRTAAELGLSRHQLYRLRKRTDLFAPQARGQFMCPRCRPRGGDREATGGEA